MNIAVFASGRGSNFAAIIKAVKEGRIKANLSLLVCDNPQAGAIRHAESAGIKVALITSEAEIIARLEKDKIELIVLAGFMRLLSAAFVRRFQGRILNIHPAILPAFKGRQAILDAFDYGAKVTGVTVHFVDEKTDHGPIILQEALSIGENDTLEGLEEKIHALEHKLYPLAINLFTQGKLKIEGRKVKIS